MVTTLKNFSENDTKILNSSLTYIPVLVESFAAPWNQILKNKSKKLESAKICTSDIIEMKLSF